MWLRTDLFGILMAWKYQGETYFRWELCGVSNSLMSKPLGSVKNSTWDQRPAPESPATRIGCRGCKSPAPFPDFCWASRRARWCTSIGAKLWAVSFSMATMCFDGSWLVGMQSILHILNYFKYVNIFHNQVWFLATHMSYVAACMIQVAARHWRSTTCISGWWAVQCLYDLGPFSRFILYIMKLLW